MTVGQKEYAIRQGLNRMDFWRDATNRLPRFSTYYYEFGATVEESVIFGIRAVLGLKIAFDESEQLIDDDQEAESTPMKTNKKAVEEAEEIALNRLKQWVDCIGWIDSHEGGYYLMEGVIKDAVCIGVRVSTGNKIRFDRSGSLIRDNKKDFGSRGEEPGSF